MKKYRVIVDIPRGSIVPSSAETVEVEGTLYVRMADGSLRPASGEEIHSGREFISTTYHDDLAAAYAQAIEEIDRRIEELAAIRSTTVRSMAPAGEVVHV